MSEWKEYHEPLARIYREVKKALPYYKTFYGDKAIEMMFDPEMEVEITNLITKMIEDVEMEEKNIVINARLLKRPNVGECQRVFNRYGIRDTIHTGTTTDLCAVIRKLENDLNEARGSNE